MFQQFIDRYATDAYGPPVGTLEAIERAAAVGEIKVLDINYPFAGEDVTVEQVRETGKSVSVFTNNNEHDPVTDLSLDSAMKRHIKFVYEQAKQNQRRAAKLLGISRSTLARYLRDVAKK